MSTEGNTVSTTVSTGNTAPSVPTTDCEKAAKQNKDTRENLNDKTKDKQVVGHDDEGAGTTVSTAIVDHAEMGGTYTAHNNNKALEKLSDLAKGGSMEDRKAGASSLNCSDPPYTHPSPCCQKSGHAEARIMDQIGSAAKGASIVLNIDWQPKIDPPSKAPCLTCHAMLCYAQQECEMKISICDANNEPVPLSDFCPSDGDANKKLADRLDNPLPPALQGGSSLL